jgi:hypothetical protein
VAARHLVVMVHDQKLPREAESKTQTNQTGIAAKNGEV